MSLDSIPRFVGLFADNDNRYWEYEANETQWQRRVRVTSMMVLSETNFTKFEFVISNSNPNMVHIRTTYNNKFLQRSPDGNHLVATADEPEEDRAKRSCTLFRLVNFNPPTFPRFNLALQSENREHGVNILASEGRSLGIVPGSLVTNMGLRLIDIDTLVMLPRNLTIKGDNGMYLCSRRSGNNNILQFNSRDPLDPDVWHMSVPLNNGDVRIRSSRSGLFWRTNNDEWITDDGGQNLTQHMVFRPMRLSFEDNSIALLATLNNKYTRRWGSHNTGSDRLAASADTLIPEAVLIVQEAVRDREIYNIRYRLDQVHIYDVAPVYVAPQTVDNYSDLEASTTVRYQYEKMTEETFSSSHSWKVSLKARLRVTIVPKLVGLNVNLEAAYSGNVEWSKTVRTVQTTTSETTVAVPPKSRVLVTMYVEQGTVDVPYSYTQRDILVNGKHDIRTMHDGLFTGVNSDIIHYHISEPESLPPNAASFHEKGPNIVIYPYDVSRHIDKYIYRTVISPTISMDEKEEEQVQEPTISMDEKEDEQVQDEKIAADPI